MDINIFNILGIISIFLPLFFATYLVFARLRLSLVDKKVLDFGLGFLNLASFIIFSFLWILILRNDFSINSGFNFLTVDKFSLDFGISINELNSKFLVFASFIFTLLAFYSRFYFKAKKQFLFTKQRYFAFLSLISFDVYIFLASSNLVQAFIFFAFFTTLLFVFSYFDIFKNPTNFNISRFHRINLIGDFSLLLALLILFKYAILSKGYINSTSLDYNELNILISYMYGLSSTIEFKLMTFMFLVSVFTRLAIFPFSCFYSFLSNSSNLLYLISINNIAGIFIFLKILPLIELCEYQIYLSVLFLIGALLSLFFILFEKNIKFVFGYLISFINSVFLILFLNFNDVVVLRFYFLINLIIYSILMFLFMKNRINFKRSIISKQKGFLLERTHIIIFETFLNGINRFFIFIDEKIVQNILPFVCTVFNRVVSIFVLKTTKTNGIKNVRNILLLFAVFALLAIFIALFGRFKC